MREETIKIYTLDELPERAQERAHERYISAGDTYHWFEEDKATLNEFARIFPVKVTNYSVGSDRYDIDFCMTSEDEVSELSGWRLAAYLWNNFRRDIYKGKHYGKTRANGASYVSRRSKIILEWDACPLTGYTRDYDILQPIITFMRRPDSRDFQELMRDCLDAWGKAVRDEMEYSESFEAFKESAEANEWEFTSDGKIYR